MTGNRFGIFTDPHYSGRENDETRFFSSVPWKLECCMDFFRKNSVDFVVCLGDLLDYEKNISDREKRLADIWTIIKGSGIPFYLCLGNHDIGAYSFGAVMERFMPGQRTGYYSFNAGSLHFAVLDTNYDGRGRHYLDKTMQWDRLYVNSVQLEWLKNDLRTAGRKTVIFTHGNLNNRERDAMQDPHVVKNHPAVRRVLEESGQVCAVIQGHDHRGYYSVENGIPYITLKALVDGEYDMPVVLAEAGEQMKLSFFNLAKSEEPEYERILPL